LELLSKIYQQKFIAACLAAANDFGVQNSRMANV